jgi:hypothetical protein
MDGPDRDKWIASKEKEDKFLEDRGTFRILPNQYHDVPPGVKPMHIVPKYKIKDDGTYKTREVVLGNTDSWNGDCFAPTVCILLQSLYGLGDAPKLFNEGLVAHLKSGNYKQSAYEPCLFYKWTSMFTFIYIVFHVDDFNAAATTKDELDSFQKFLSTKYEITSNEKGVFLGILRTELPDGSVLFTKPFILQKLFDKYLPNGPTISVPSTPMSNDYLKQIGSPSPACDTTKFLSLNGLLIQLIEVRPDIAFHLSKISQQQKNPTLRDYDALMYMVHYLWGKRNWGIRLQPSRSDHSHILVKLRGYADAAYAIHCEEAGTGKSQYTECFDLVEDGDNTPEIGTGMFHFRSNRLILLCE